MRFVILVIRRLLEISRRLMCKLMWGFTPKELGRNVELDLRGHAIIGTNLRLGNGVSIIVEKNAKLIVGDNVFIGQGCFVKCYGGVLKIGNCVSLNPYCFVNAGGGIDIGDATRIGAHSIIIASNHNFSDAEVLIKDQGITQKGISIGKNNWLGARVTILDGVSTVQGSVFAAGSVVHKAITFRGIYAGVPAVLKKEI